MLRLEVFDQFPPPGPALGDQPGFSRAGDRGRQSSPRLVPTARDDDRCGHRRLRRCYQGAFRIDQFDFQGASGRGWVAQGGVKARMAASMWLNRPSVTSRPMQVAGDVADGFIRTVVVGGGDDELAMVTTSFSSTR